MRGGRRLKNNANKRKVLMVMAEGGGVTQRGNIQKVKMRREGMEEWMLLNI